MSTAASPVRESFSSAVWKAANELLDESLVSSLIREGATFDEREWQELVAGHLTGMLRAALAGGFRPSVRSMSIALEEAVRYDQMGLKQPAAALDMWRTLTAGCEVIGAEYAREVAHSVGPAACSAARSTCEVREDLPVEECPELVRVVTAWIRADGGEEDAARQRRQAPSQGSVDRVD